MAIAAGSASGDLLVKTTDRKRWFKSYLLSRGDVVDMIAESDEQVEEEGSSAVVHLQLHGAAALEGAPAADDEGEVVGAQLRVGLGGVVVSVSSRRQDGAALNARLCR